MRSFDPSALRRCLVPAITRGACPPLNATAQPGPGHAGHFFVIGLIASNGAACSEVQGRLSTGAVDNPASIRHARMALSTSRRQTAGVLVLVPVPMPRYSGPLLTRALAEALLAARAAGATRLSASFDLGRSDAQV